MTKERKKGRKEGRKEEEKKRRRRGEEEEDEEVTDEPCNCNLNGEDGGNQYGDNDLAIDMNTCTGLRLEVARIVPQHPLHLETSHLSDCMPNSRSSAAN